MPTLTSTTALPALTDFTGPVVFIPDPEGYVREVSGVLIVPHAYIVTATDGQLPEGTTIAPGAYTVTIGNSKPFKVSIDTGDGPYDLADCVVSGTVNPPASTRIHGNLTGRDAADQHPISAVTGLQDALDSKAGISTGAIRSYATLADLMEETGTPSGMALIRAMSALAMWWPESTETHDGVKWIKLDSYEETDEGRYEIVM